MYHKNIHKTRRQAGGIYTLLSRMVQYWSSIVYNLRVGLIGGGTPPRNRGFKFQTGCKQVGYFRINTNEFPECRECAGELKIIDSKCKNLYSQHCS